MPTLTRTQLRICLNNYNSMPLTLDVSDGQYDIINDPSDCQSEMISDDVFQIEVKNQHIMTLLIHDLIWRDKRLLTVDYESNIIFNSHLDGSNRQRFRHYLTFENCSDLELDSHIIISNGEWQCFNPINLPDGQYKMRLLTGYSCWYRLVIKSKYLQNITGRSDISDDSYREINHQSQIVTKHYLTRRPMQPWVEPLPIIASKSDDIYRYYEGLINRNIIKSIQLKYPTLVDHHVIFKDNQITPRDDLQLNDGDYQIIGNYGISLDIATISDRTLLKLSSYLGGDGSLLPRLIWHFDYTTNPYQMFREFPQIEPNQKILWTGV